MFMFKRTKRIAKANLKQLIKRLEKPVYVMEEAKTDLKRRAIELRTYAKGLEKKAIACRDTAVRGQMQLLADKLTARAEACKSQYLEYDQKIEVLKARKELATQHLGILKADLGLDGNSELEVLKDFEKDVIKLEAEVEACMEML